MLSSINWERGLFNQCLNFYGQSEKCLVLSTTHSVAKRHLPTYQPSLDKGEEGHTSITNSQQNGWFSHKNKR